MFECETTGTLKLRGPEENNCNECEAIDKRSINELTISRWSEFGSIDSGNSNILFRDRVSSKLWTLSRQTSYDNIRRHLVLNLSYMEMLMN